MQKLQSIRLKDKRSTLQSKIHVIQVTRGYKKIPLEGIETFIAQTSKNMAKLGYKVSQIERCSPNEKQTIRNDGQVTVIQLAFPHLSNWGKSIPQKIAFLYNETNTALFAIGTLAFLSVRKDFDAIYVHIPLISIVLALSLRIRKKLIYTCHSDVWGQNSAKLSGLQKLALFSECQAMKRASKIVAPNLVLKKMFASCGIDENKIVTLNYGVDLDFFNPGLSAGSIKSKFGLNGFFNVLFVGRLAESKGIAYLLKAANILVNKNNYSSIHFLIVGSIQKGAIVSSINFDEINNFISANNLQKQVLFLGSLTVEDLQRLYIASDVFVLPSLFDLSPRVIAEAMASGKPVVATRVGVIPTLIHNYSNGLLVDPGNEFQLAEAIKYLFEHPLEVTRLGSNARVYAEKEFDSKKITQKYATIGLNF